MKTKQIVFTKPYVAELTEVEYMPPKENEVTVCLSHSAISAGTEKANFIGMRNGPDVSENAAPVFPRTVGYSAAGIVTETGENVRDIRVGDRVVVYWGKHKQHITVNRNNVTVIPDGISTEEAALAFIATFPLAAIRKTGVEIGESAMVMGLGVLGIFAVQELRAAGAYPIIAADPVKERRDFALRMGADFAIDPTKEDFAKTVHRLSRDGVNVCIEGTGLGEGLIKALDCMKKMGRIALMGCTRNSSFEIDYYGKVHGRGISLIGAHTMARPKTESSRGLWTDSDDLNAILNLVKGGRMNLKDMICEIHSPADAQAVYDRLVSEKSFPIGVLFDWSRV